MSDTPRFAMPLLDAAQAQKHVTVNEALSRADALAAGRVARRDLSAPPSAPEDGEVFVVAAGASGDWAGQDGALALFLNGGWEFVAPWEGARFRVAAERLDITRDGGAWNEGTIAGAAGGAVTFSRILELDQALAGASVTTPAVIPDKAIVLGVTGRVIQEITGATSWSLGVAGATGRYGTGYGTGAGAFAHGVTGQPQAYYGGTALVMDAAGGSFAGGTVRLAVHLLGLAPPEPA